MPYATQAQIQLAAGGESDLIELSDLNGDGAIDADVIAKAQADADGWINGYIRARHATPIAVPSDTLIEVAAMEAVYRMRKARRMTTADDRDDHEERERWCKDVGSGKVRLDEPLPVKSTAVRSAFVKRDDASTHPVSREGTKGFW